MPPAVASSDLYDVINRRRDVRAEFTGAPIGPDALHRILTAAHAAPSVGLSQPWDFILVRNESLRSRFQAHVQTERELFESTLTAEESTTFRKIKIEGIQESSLGIVVTYDPSRGAARCPRAPRDRRLRALLRRPGDPELVAGGDGGSSSGSAGFPSTANLSSKSCSESPLGSDRWPGCASARCHDSRRFQTWSDTAGVNADHWP